MRKPAVQVSLTRRQFGAAAATTALAASQVTAATPSDGWIDAHVHVWTPDTSAYPLDASFDKSAMQPPSFTPEELFTHTKPVGVSRVVLIQMSFYNLDNRYMLDMMRKHSGVFGGVGIVDHHDKNVAARMKELAKGGVKGFRISGRGGKPSTWPDDAGMATVWKTAAAENLAVCPLINPSDLPFVDSLCRKYPETKVVVDHFARVGVSGKIESSDLEALCRLAEHPKTHVKTSAFYALGKKSAPYTDLSDMIRRVVNAYGSERLMWASDCPYQVQGKHSYAASIALVRDHLDFLTETDKANMLRDTAAKLFF